jgi:hypothetical protein
MTNPTNAELIEWLRGHAKLHDQFKAPQLAEIAVICRAAADRLAVLSDVEAAHGILKQHFAALTSELHAQLVCVDELKKANKELKTALAATRVE